MLYIITIVMFIVMVWGCYLYFTFTKGLEYVLELLKSDDFQKQWNINQYKKNECLKEREQEYFKSQLILGFGIGQTLSIILFPLTISSMSTSMVFVCCCLYSLWFLLIFNLDNIFKKFLNDYAKLIRPQFEVYVQNNQREPLE